MEIGTLAFQSLDRLTGVLSGVVGLIVVDRYHGPAGLGLFAWFLSLYAIAGFFARFGIPLAIENRMAQDSGKDPETPARALAALVALGLAVACAGCLAAIMAPGPGYDKADSFFYLSLGPLVLAGNINALRLAMINGTGRHRAAAGLKIRQRIVALVALFILCKTRLPVPFLALSVFAGQVAILFRGRKTLRLPSLVVAMSKRQQIRETIALGRAFLLTDAILDLVFYLDMLVLGWFVGPDQLGIYARALILVRLFLLIPAGLRPILRRQANRLTGANANSALKRLSARGTRALFVGHALAALFLLLHFTSALQWFFGDALGAEPVFELFAIVLPGLIFFSVTVVSERVFEANRDTALLEGVVIRVAVMNFILDINLIPFAGTGGAALATSLSMFFYFLLLGHRMPADFASARIRWPGAAAALYLTYVMLNHDTIGYKTSLFLIPLLFCALLWMIGFFKIKENKMTLHSAASYRQHNEQPS